jgi:integrase
MATIRERQRKDGTRQYQAQVRIAGFPARTASFTTRRQAERWAKTVEADMIEGRHYRNVEARRRTLAEAIDRYLEIEVPKKRSGGGMHRSYLKYWRGAIGKVKLADVTPALVAEHRDKLASGTYQRAKPDAKRSKVKGEPQQFKRASSTVDKYLACLGHVFTVARKEWHWASHNPLEDVAKLKKGGGRVRCLSDDERKALLTQTAKDPTLHTFVVMALSTACRAGELRKLKWPDVDLKNGRVLFRAETTKTEQPRVVWLYGEALRLLKEHAKVRELSGKVFANAGGSRRKRGQGTYDYSTPFKAAIAATGILDFRFHDLRHSAATYLAQQGATEQQLRAIGGWKSNVVSKYVHLAAHDAKAQLEKLAEKIGQ